jgi:hypothetical protein
MGYVRRRKSVGARVDRLQRFHHIVEDQADCMTLSDHAPPTHAEDSARAGKSIEMTLVYSMFERLWAFAE